MCMADELCRTCALGDGMKMTSYTLIVRLDEDRTHVKRADIVARKHWTLQLKQADHLEKPEGKDHSNVKFDLECRAYIEASELDHEY
jgi:hypothetical protein